MQAMTETNSKEIKRKLETKDLTLIGVFTAIIVIISQLSIPMPNMVPITLQTFAMLLAGIVLGAKRGTIAVLIYLFLGAVGLPVFAGGVGGLSFFVGPTGGFLFTFPLMALIMGLFMNMKGNKILLLTVGMVLASAVNFLGGTLIFMFATKATFLVALSGCVLPYIPGTIIKCIAAGAIGIALDKRNIKL